MCNGSCTALITDRGGRVVQGDAAGLLFSRSSTSALRAIAISFAATLPGAKSRLEKRFTRTRGSHTGGDQTSKARLVAKDAGAARRLHYSAPCGTLMAKMCVLLAIKSTSLATTGVL